MTVHVRLVGPAGEAIREVTVSAFPARIGRDPAAEVSIGDHEFPVVSGLHAEIDHTPAGLVLTPRSPKNLTLLNDRPVDGPVALAPGDRVRLGATGPTVLVVAIEPELAEPSEELPAPVRRPARRKPRARSAVMLVAGLLLHLIAVLLILVLTGVIANPIARPKNPVPTARP
jgi:pSer/pThr/pTyr-binding forkhead associated (FHA) protein